MSEQEALASAPVGGDPAGQAGALLRAARQGQGLHIAALAAAIKVSPAKLEALESGRYADLPDLTFARALAQTVCRQLKIDPAPVLAQLPGAPASTLEKVDEGLNTPFRDRPGQVDPALWLPWRRPVPWLAGLLLVLAAAFVLVPMRADLLPAGAPAVGPSPVMPPAGAAATPEAGVPAAVPASAVSPSVTVMTADTTTAATAVPVLPAATTPAPFADLVSSAPAAAGPKTEGAVLRASQDTWVQVSDATGQTLTSRLIPAGETVEFAGKLPLKLRIGNARGTELRFRGQPVDLKSSSRDNVATLTLP